MVSTVYIVAVWLIGARAFFVAAEKTVLRDQKKVFFLKFVESSCKEGRGQTMRGSGQYMIQNDQIQRSSVYMMYKDHIQCRNYEPAVVSTLHVQKMQLCPGMVREWCGMTQTCNPSWQI